MADRSAQVTPEEFFELWCGLCRRFRREPENLEAMMYLEYLDVRLGAEQVREAVRSLWASAEFFPRPVDFVLAAHADVVTRLRKAAAMWQQNPQSSWALSLGSDGITLAVLGAIGGIGQVQALAQVGAQVMRREVEATILEVLADDARREPGALAAGGTTAAALWRPVRRSIGPQRVGTTEALIDFERQLTGGQP